mmetsp:Transcript_7906/g.48860  ORF Transcript_7906/g.48860 Transcript_7906/m.48860 type:complete len:451 (-) Transcript_7906:82-1434(-)|eukprot:CAMPEP_0183830492 /NCGR_PEP_ID=MMETSP0807_2-20130328/4055_1 /TAXON_ID=88271 /ORGANISM="Picocystis salinarum, Strain CCMP1897" /LENGTH=450 /DNA_ID=CAMNT_0026075863 /DNA_START=54 /DNA_END=1406 /DNA_ORIENTATION=-
MANVNLSGWKKASKLACMVAGTWAWTFLVVQLGRRRWNLQPLAQRITSGKAIQRNGVVWETGQLLEGEAKAELYENAHSPKRERSTIDWNVCKFENVCVNLTHIIFDAHVERETAFSIEDNLRSCCQNDVPCEEHRAICDCLHKHGGVHAYRGWQVALSTEWIDLPHLEGDTWLLNTKVTRSHPWHFAMKVVQLASILTHRNALPIPLPGRVAFQDYPVQGMSDWDHLVWKISAGVWGGSTEEYFTVGAHRPTCFQSMYFTSEYDRFFKHREEVAAWRKSMLGTIGKQLCNSDSLDCYLSWCAPPLIGILHRIEGTAKRSVVNMKEVEHTLAQSFGLAVEHFNVSSLDSPLSQAQKFVRYRVIFSAHSSQLANLLYAHPAAVVIEVCVDCDPVFRILGESLGLFYVRSRFHIPASDAPSVKNSDVQVNIGTLASSIRPAVEYLRAACIHS